MPRARQSFDQITYIIYGLNFIRKCPNKNTSNSIEGVVALQTYAYCEKKIWQELNIRKGSAETKASNTGRRGFEFDFHPTPLAEVPPLTGKPVVRGQLQECVGKCRQDLRPCAWTVEERVYKLSLIMTSTVFPTRAIFERTGFNV